LECFQRLRASKCTVLSLDPMVCALTQLRGLERRLFLLVGLLHSRQHLML
jgi:hypothetical protein